MADIKALRERIAKIRGGKNVGVSDKAPDNSSSSDSSSVLLSRELLYPNGREECVANLKLAVALNIYGRKFCYPNYMETGFAVCDALLPEDCHRSWFRDYCLEPYPDVCRCGQMFYGSYSNLRNHCIICKGDWKRDRVDAYTIDRLATHLGVHLSWIEYAAAWALSKYKTSE